jgi:catechol-2,3-dioxygenase
MPTEKAAQPWALRSTLIAVSDLDRSVSFYGEVGPFEEIARQDAVVVLGERSASAIVLILRELRGHQTRHGQQSLGLRSISFRVGSIAELDRIEAILRARSLYTSRHQIDNGASELVRGRDPDNLPLVFVCYDDSKMFGPHYYSEIANLFYSLDV